MKKIVVFRTLGIRWGMYPGAPSTSVLQHVVDVRGAVSDPGPMFPNITGLDTVVSSWTLSQPGLRAWMEREQAQMSSRIEELNAHTFSTLVVYYHCHGGCQRSVVIAEAMASWLRERYPVLIVRVEHLTMLLTQAAKAAEEAKG